MAQIEGVPMPPHPKTGAETMAPHADPTRFDNGFTLTNERTNELTDDLQDQGSNRLVPDTPTPVDNRKSSRVKEVCRTCGERATLTCGCGAPICAKHAWFYVDDSNAAISRSARAQCGVCYRPKYPRPFELVRAIERGEWGGVS